MSLAPEQDRLERLDFSHEAVGTVQGMRVPSTTLSYSTKWSAFRCGCVERGKNPMLCPLSCVNFPPAVSRQTLVLALNTIKTYAVAITSCQRGFLRGICFLASTD